MVFRFWEKSGLDKCRKVWVDIKYPLLPTPNTYIKSEKSKKIRAREGERVKEKGER
jgi:hypothetical protein